MLNQPPYFHPTDPIQAPIGSPNMDSDLNIYDMVIMINHILYTEGSSPSYWLFNEQEIFFGDIAPINYESPLESGNYSVNVNDVIAVVYSIISNNLRCIEDNDGTQPYYDWSNEELGEICPTYAAFLANEGRKK